MGVDDFDESTPPPKQPLTLDEANELLDCENRISQLEKTVEDLRAKVDLFRLKLDNILVYVRLASLRLPPNEE